MALRDLLILIVVLALHSFAFGQSSDHCVDDGLDMDPRGYHYVGGRDAVYLFKEDGNLVSKDGKEWTTINEVRPRKAAAPAPEQTGQTSSTKPSGPNVDQMSAHLDILPTLVDLCGLHSAENYRTDGLSRKPVLDGSVINLGARVLVESFNGIAMTKGRRHMRHPRLEKDPTFDSRLLYDMSADPPQKSDIAKEHLKVVSRLGGVQERVNAKNDNRQPRYTIGSDQQNPVEFTPSAWSKRISTWQKGIRIETPGAAAIFAEVELPGIYRFSLRRWPAEINEPIRPAPELSVPDGFEGKTTTKRERALPMVKARLNCGGFDETVGVMDDMVEAVFTVTLKTGDCDILAQFIADDGKGRRQRVRSLVSVRRM